MRHYCLKSNCSNPRVSVSNLYYLIKLLLLFPAYFIYTPFVTLSMFVALSNFRRLIILLSSSHPFLSIHFLTLSTNHINVPAQYITHNSLSCFNVRTLSALIQFPYSPGVFGYRAILTMGGSDRGWGFLLEQSDTLHTASMLQYKFN